MAVTDRPDRPDTDRCPPSDVEDAPPSRDTAPPEPAEFLPLEARGDPMAHAPRWGYHLNSRLDDFSKRLEDFSVRFNTLAESVGRIIDVHAGVPALREGIVQDISSAVAKWVNPILEDNAAMQSMIQDLHRRLTVVEGKVAQAMKGPP